MTKTKLLTLTGSVATVLAGGGAVAFLPPQYAALVTAVAGLVLGWLHLPTPGTVKVTP